MSICRWIPKEKNWVLFHWDCQLHGTFRTKSGSVTNFTDPRVFNDAALLFLMNWRLSWFLRYFGNRCLCYLCYSPWSAGCQWVAWRSGCRGTSTQKSHRATRRSRLWWGRVGYQSWQCPRHGSEKWALEGWIELPTRGQKMWSSVDHCGAWLSWFYLYLLLTTAREQTKICHRKYAVQNLHLQIRWYDATQRLRVVDEFSVF